RPCRCATLANPTVSVRVQRPTSSVVLDGLLRIRSERLPGVAGERGVPLVVHRIPLRANPQGTPSRALRGHRAMRRQYLQTALICAGRESEESSKMIGEVTLIEETDFDS